MLSKEYAGCAASATCFFPATAIVYGSFPYEEVRQVSGFSKQFGPGFCVASGGGVLPRVPSPLHSDFDVRYIALNDNSYPNPKVR